MNLKLVFEDYADSLRQLYRKSEVSNYRIGLHCIYYVLTDLNYELHH